MSYLRRIFFSPNEPFRMLDEIDSASRASREFRHKFPDEIVTDNLGGQLWFGAECLAAGSSIMNKVTAVAGKHFAIHTLLPMLGTCGYFIFFCNKKCHLCILY